MVISKEGVGEKGRGERDKVTCKIKMDRMDSVNLFAQDAGGERAESLEEYCIEIVIVGMVR